MHEVLRSSTTPNRSSRPTSSIAVVRQTSACRWQVEWFTCWNSRGLTVLFQHRPLGVLVQDDVHPRCRPQMYFWRYPRSTWSVSRFVKVHFDQSHFLPNVLLSLDEPEPMGSLASTLDPTCSVVETAENLIVLCLFAVRRHLRLTEASCYPASMTTFRFPWKINRRRWLMTSSMNVVVV